MAARCASYVDKLIKGARPGDLPMEQPARVHLAINLATAKKLNVVVPTSVLASADKVIEA
jgi:putative ABC transport system substrate-binding protein